MQAAYRDEMEDAENLESQYSDDELLNELDD